MSAGQPNGESLARLLELTLPQFFHWRSGAVVGTVCGRKVCEVVANPGRDFVHGESNEAGDGKPRSRIA